MTITQGIKEIEEARWAKDEWQTLNLYVHDDKDRTVHAFLSLRPSYCDRGHISLNIDAPGIELDGHDSFPRFFFSFAEADAHTRLFLKWRLWKERTFPHELEAP